MKARKIEIEPTELTDLDVDDEATSDGRHYVRIGNDAHAFVTDDEALAIAEAWRTVEQRILTARYGELATL